MLSSVLVLLTVGFSVWQQPGQAEDKVLTSENPEVQRAIQLAVAGEYEEAGQIFRRELSRSPEDPLLEYFVGLVDYKSDRLNPAIAHFEKAIRLGAEFPQAFEWLARAWLDKGRIDEARDILLSGLEKFPRNEALLELNRELDS